MAGPFDTMGKQRVVRMITATAGEAAPRRELTKLRISHSTTQRSNARASASARGRPPSNSAILARSSKKPCQSSADQPSSPDEGGRFTADLWRASRSRTAAGGRAGAVSDRSSPSISTSNAGGARRLESLCRAHIRPFQPGTPFWLGVNWAGAGEGIGSMGGIGIGRSPAYSIALPPRSASGA